MGTRVEGPGTVNFDISPQSFTVILLTVQTHHVYPTLKRCENSRVYDVLS